MYKVTVDNEVLFAEKGEKLSDVLIKNGKTVQHICGGRGVCGKCRVAVDGKEERSCKYKIEKDICVVLPNKDNIISEHGAEVTGVFTENMCYVLDIGTTTLALALVSLDDKKIVGVKTCINPQVPFGADVMTRIDYCRNNSVSELQKTLIKSIEKAADEFKCGRLPKIYVTGNTTMLHIFFGVSPVSLGAYPYTPVFLEKKTEKSFLKCADEIESLPSISSFFGADLTAGMNFAGFPSKDKFNLLVDLGTNAEIVLYSSEKALCTSAAAGPCFEGANISCGMNAVEGAVYAFDGKNIKTVESTAPKGICGTGLIDIIAELLKNGTVDKTGYMENEKYFLSSNVYLSDRDIRQYQLAKSAVFSAIKVLMKRQGISFESIEKMYISGGFSSKINIENAVLTGLLPKELKNKYIAVNNSSLLGTVKFVCEKNDLEKLVEIAEYTDLSLTPDFTEKFIKNMDFDI